MALADDIAREMAARNGESAASPPDPLDDLTRRWSEEAGFDLPEEPETSEPPYTPQGVEPPDTNGHGLDALTRKWSEEAGFALPKPAPQPAAPESKPGSKAPAGIQDWPAFGSGCSRGPRPARSKES